MAIPHSRKTGPSKKEERERRYSGKINQEVKFPFYTVATPQILGFCYASSRAYHRNKIAGFTQENNSPKTTKKSRLKITKKERWAAVLLASGRCPIFLDFLGS